MAFNGTKKLQASNTEPQFKEQPDDDSSIGTGNKNNKFQEKDTTKSKVETSENVNIPISQPKPAFTGTKKVEVETNSDDIVMPDFLTPKKDAKKDSFNDPYKEEVTHKTAYQITLKTLNALRIVSPIIGALMQRPGVDAQNEEISTSFRSLIQETSNLSLKTCELMNIEPEKEKNFWIRNVLEKHFADLFKDQWVKNGAIDSDRLLNLITVVIEKSESFADNTGYDDLDELTLLRVGTISAMTKVINEAQTNFDLYRVLENDIEPIMNKLYNLTADVVNRLSDEYASSKDRAKLFNMIIKEAGDLYAGAWHAEGIRTQSIIKNTPKEKLDKTLEKYKSNGGLPIDKIEHDFDKYFNKMVIITEKLIFSQKGTLEKRLKVK